ncbi:hypothetical protein BFN03_08025 [Rhodococcus sp. WMMA185]|uniref:hypothetical protein n=1 Tax=Rhodococcus sp. WMMA185 TaxID=679318 RepID=UPI00087830D8|nr:hypothetical protein [Rhodococcus sp. WMMA185]AOW92660.1 hypothetical protein BFN03_08025 [Rhodococcus sp. WMMA185]
MSTQTWDEPSTTYSTEWLRSALRRCDLLERTYAVSSDARWMIDFALQWAPFGGATDADVLVRFGVTRHRFMDLVLAGLAPKEADPPKIRAMKNQLCISLAQAWNVQ